MKNTYEKLLSLVNSMEESDLVYWWNEYFADNHNMIIHDNNDGELKDVLDEAPEGFGIPDLLQLAIYYGYSKQDRYFNLSFFDDGKASFSNGSFLKDFYDPEEVFTSVDDIENFINFTGEKDLINEMHKIIGE